MGTVAISKDAMNILRSGGRGWNAATLAEYRATTMYSQLALPVPTAPTCKVVHLRQSMTLILEAFHAAISRSVLRERLVGAYD